MSGRKKSGTEDAQDAASRARKPAKSKEATPRLVEVRLGDLQVPVAAKAMAKSLRDYARELESLAEQMENKGEDDVFVFDWPPKGILRCNGGGE